MECAARIGLAADYGFHRRGFHATGVAGHFSAALAAGRLMGLDEAALASAQGVCVSTAAASREFWSDGAWNKRLHPGWAAAAGITAAGLAGAGFKGCERPYDGRFGLFRMMMGGEADHVDFALLAGGLGERWELLESAVKPFPTCHYTHAIIDSAIALRRDYGLEPDEIAGVTVLVHEDLIAPLMQPEALKRSPPDDYAARFSAPWAAACGLALGRLGLAELEPQALSDPQVLALAARVRCRPDRTRCSRAIFSAGVEVETRSGERYRRHEAVNRGAGGRALGNAGIVEKFHANAAPALGEAWAEAAAAHVLGMERLAGKALMQGLVRPAMLAAPTRMSRKGEPMTRETALYERDGAIATITLNRPEKLNAFDDAAVEALSEALARFDADPDANVAILHGAGRAFSTGADVLRRQLRPRAELERFGGPQGAGPIPAGSSSMPSTGSRWSPRCTAMSWGLPSASRSTATCWWPGRARASRSPRPRAASAARSIGADAAAGRGRVRRRGGR